MTDTRDWFDPSPFIADSHKLVDAIGEWPSFDDAEVIALHLDRTDGSPWQEGSLSPTLTMVVRLAEAPGYHLVEIQFNNVRNLELTAFSYQNALQEIVFDPLESRVDSQGNAIFAGVSAVFIAHTGLCGKFEFQSGAVLSVVSCDRDGRV